MSSIKNSELVLNTYPSQNLKDRLNKYDLFLDTLYSEDYGFLREAVKTCVMYLINPSFATQKDLALKNFRSRPVLQNNHNSESGYLSFFPFADKKACSLDLATGSGKSYLMFGIAIVMLCEEQVENVLVLCPSKTIEGELFDKFKTLVSKGNLSDILQQINPDYSPPSIKQADVTIGKNQVCIENIHAVYDTTGSSIPHSFGNQKGKNTLVLNDEAHHVFSQWLDNKQKHWEKFLNSADNAFHYIVNVTGTPYYESQNDAYFRDVIYRFPLKDAMERGIVKHIDSRYGDDNQSNLLAPEQIIAVHEAKRVKYGAFVTPLSIVICEKISSAILEWNRWVNKISTTENISIEEAREKVIWVTSGLPSKGEIEGNANLKTILAGLDGGAKLLNTYNETLKTVDGKESRVEWIISVAKLTEGWDVKRVFQIIPMEERAFNSRLLIAQVLGRGLRVPPELKAIFPKEEITVTINNHPRFFQDIKDIYEEVLEIKDRASWGFNAAKTDYDVQLYNLIYKEKTEVGEQTTGAPETFLGNFNFADQKREYTAESDFRDIKEELRRNRLTYTYQEEGDRELEEAARELYSYIAKYDKTPDKRLTNEFTPKKLTKKISSELSEKKYDATFLSKKNFTQAQYALAPMFRQAGEKATIYKTESSDIDPLSMSAFSKQSFSESALLKDGFFYFDDATVSWYQNEEEKVWVEKRVNIEASIAKLATGFNGATNEEVARLGKEITTLNDLKKHFVRVPNIDFKTPLNAIYVSFEPERKFMEALVRHADKVDWFIKSPDKGFYSIPFQHEAKGSTHSKTYRFNPDFFLKVLGKNDIVVVEIKKKDDLDPKNKAKLRDTLRHFEDLNNRLTEKGIEQRYCFKFLSDDGNDLGQFFQSLKSGEYIDWTSQLMRDLAS
jgi:type III restriction enzyme